MSIKSIYEKGDYTFQNFNVSKEDKYKYGEIYTPFSLIEKMFNLMDDSDFNKKDKKWLDTGSGTGYFSIYLYKSLMNGLKEVIQDINERHDHIIKNMIYMVEIKESNVEILRDYFGKEANIVCGDYTTEYFGDDELFDFIIGNPPYNSCGIKKVPTNNSMNKKNDGKTIWIQFIHRSISLLKKNGKLLYIVPSIWMKPDKARMYHLLTEYKIEKIVSLNNTETNIVFNGNGQTPTCYFLLKNEKIKSEIESETEIELYDKDRENFTKYTLKIGKPIPVYGSHIINKLGIFIKKYGCLNPIKTNVPKRGTILSLVKDESYPYSNIKTCIIENKVIPKLVVEYSNTKQSFSGIEKLVLAHKMYGFPYLDSLGIYGISNRDNYVLLKDCENKKYSLEELERLKQYLSTKFALFVFESTRYRMKYLEKYAFEFFPDITRIIDFPTTVNDETISSYFGLDEKDIECIQKLHRKNYAWFD